MPKNKFVPPSFCSEEYYKNSLDWYISQFVMKVKGCFWGSIFLVFSALSFLFVCLACVNVFPLSRGKPFVTEVGDVYDSQVTRYKIADGESGWRGVQMGLAKYILSHYVSIRETVGAESPVGGPKFMEDYSSRNVYKYYKTWNNSSEYRQLYANLSKERCTAIPYIDSIDLVNGADSSNSRATINISMYKSCPNQEEVKLHDKQIIMVYSMSSPQLVSRGKASFHFIVSEYTTIML